MTDHTTQPIPPPPSPDDVRHVLAGVLDPELRASIVDLGMVHDVQVDPDGSVLVKVALTTAACPLRGQIGNDVSSKVAGLPGVTDVRVEYDEMTQDERSSLMQRARLAASSPAPGYMSETNARYRPSCENTGARALPERFVRRCASPPAARSSR